MLSRQKLPHPWPRHWTDETCYRKSRDCARLATSAILLALTLSLFIPISRPDIVIPKGALPLTMELRQFIPTPPPAPAPQEENRKLLSEEPFPESLLLPEPPKPEPVVEPPKPEPEPVVELPEQEPPKPEPVVEHPKPVKPLPAKKPVKKTEKTAATTPTVAPPSVSAGEGVSSSAAAPGHAAGVETSRPNRTGEILAALLHVVEARKEYPKQARRQNVEGTLTLKVLLDGRGKITGCTLASNSGKSVLDVAGRKLSEKLVGLEIAAANTGKSLEILVPVNYSLK